MAVMFLKILFSETARQRMLTLGKLTDVCLMVGFIAFVVASHRLLTFYIHPLSLIRDFDAFFFARFTLWVGLIGAFIHFFDIWVVWMNTYIGNRKTGIKILFFFYLLKLALFGLSISIWVMLLYQSTQINTGLKLGLRTTMNEYKKYPFTKENLDRMQQNFACCGDTSYKDWFGVQWVPDDFISMASPKTGQNVPYSCCDSSSLRPCISNNIEKSQTGYSSNDKNIFTRGCRDVIIDQYTWFTKVFLQYPIYAIFLVYILHLFTLRYAQTSINSALSNGHPAFEGYGYLLGFGVGVAEVQKKLPMDVRRRMMGGRAKISDKTPLMHRLKLAEKEDTLRRRKLELDRQRMLRDGVRRQDEMIRQSGPRPF